MNFFELIKIKNLQHNVILTNVRISNAFRDADFHQHDTEFFINEILNFEIIKK